MTMDLFSSPPGPEKGPTAPLAERIRPRNLDEFVGQNHLLGQGSLLRRAILTKKIPSMILWGPPGSGKTTLARLIARHSHEDFVSFSAVTSGVKEIKDVIQHARHVWTYAQKKTILFVDEIHRFNKAQQDAFLPHIEKGTIILIGATTENPSFEVIAPLLSRTRVFQLRRLDEKDLLSIITHALADKERGLGNCSLRFTSEALDYIAFLADGDARAALNSLELAAACLTPADPRNTPAISVAQIQEAMQKKALLYDKGGEEHYNLISALHKSLRDGDPDGALYWLVRMLEAGENPLYLARRMVRFASEDIGNADPQALQVAIAGYQSYQLIGSPEGDLSLAHVAVYLACAPKSNAVYKAYGEVLQDVKKQGALPVPLHLRNAPTPLMKSAGYGKGYHYAHDFPDAVIDQDHLPEQLRSRRYYHPTGRGTEGEIKKRLEQWRKLKAQKGSPP